MSKEPLEEFLEEATDPDLSIWQLIFSVGNLESLEEQRKPVFEKYRALAKLRISYTHGPPKTCQF
jgi:hypothetical protein